LLYAAGRVGGAGLLVDFRAQDGEALPKWRFGMKTTYQGSCHCGAVRFEVDAVLDQVRVCDCSICRRRGALNYRVEPADFRLLTPLEDLTLYQFHTRTAKDYFCPTCGIQPFRRPRTAPELWTINVRCLEGVDFDAIAVQLVFGSAYS
jgi:hypothetical protein